MGSTVGGFGKMKKILVFISVCWLGLGVAVYLLDSRVDWKKYPPELKRKLDLMTNCLDLHKELNIALSYSIIT